MPRLNAEASTLRRSLQAADRRHTESVRSSKSAAERCDRECRQLLLPGIDFEAELQAAILNLPAMLQSSVQALQCSSVQEVSRVYLELVQSSCEGSRPSSEQLPALKSLLCNTVEPGTPPDLSHLSSELHSPSEHGATGVPATCMDYEGVPGDDVHAPGSAASTELDRDDCETDACAEDAWGITTVHEGDAELCELESDLMDGCADAPGEGAGGQCGAVAGASAGSAAVGEEEAAASRIAFDDDFRAQLLADLYEIRAFCTRKVEEADSPEAQGAFGAMMHGAEQAVAAEVCRDAVAGIDGLLDSLQGRPDVQTFLRVSTSKVFAARLLRQFALSKQQASLDL
jgi:hypothetical protein